MVARSVTGRRTREHPPVYLAARAGFRLALALTVVSATLLGAQEAPVFEELSRLDLPDAVERVTDVRWLSDDELLLGVGSDGIHAWRIGDDETRIVASRAEAVGRRRGFESYSRIGGASSAAVAFGGAIRGVHLQDADGTRLLKPVEIVGDMDRRGSLTAAVGLSRRSGDYGRGDWEDHIAWLFEDDRETPRDLLPTRDAGQSMDRCWEADLSSIRFISDDRVLVVPGGEPGVFVYDRSGALIESLATETFTADGGCEIEEGQGVLLSQPLYGLAWLGQRRVIDEVVADGEGSVWYFVRSAVAAGHPDVLPSPADAESAESGVGREDPALEEIRERSRASGRVSGGDAEKLLEAAGDAVHETLIDTGESVDGGRRMIRVRRWGFDQPSDGSAYDPRDPPLGKVCWDLVHATVQDLTGVTRLPCVVSSDLADARLRADVRDGKAVVLIRGFDGVWARPAEAFEATIAPPGR